MEIATFGGGCFWGMEDLFRHLEGVEETAVGYMGGDTEDPSYEEVCSDTTGHVEVVQIRFDPSRIGYEKLLGIFWMAHDPTQAGGQGNDIGSQYRPVIFYHSERQKELAEKSKAEEQKNHTRPIATSIEPAGRFWKAEEYHQRYLQKNPGGYCHIDVRAILERTR